MVSSRPGRPASAVIRTRAKSNPGASWNPEPPACAESRQGYAAWPCVTRCLRTVKPVGSLSSRTKALVMAWAEGSTIMVFFHEASPWCSGVRSSALARQLAGKTRAPHVTPDISFRRRHGAGRGRSVPDPARACPARVGASCHRSPGCGRHSASHGTCRTLACSIAFTFFWLPGWPGTATGLHLPVSAVGSGFRPGAHPAEHVPGGTSRRRWRRHGTFRHSSVRFRVRRWL